MIRDETNTLTLVRDPDPERCPVQVMSGESRWPSFSQCSRKPKEDIQRKGGEPVTVCGFHVGIVKRANEKHAKYEAERGASEGNRQVGEEHAKELTALGFTAEPHYRASWNNLGGYTGGVVLSAEAAAALLDRLRDRESPIS